MMVLMGKTRGYRSSGTKPRPQGPGILIAVVMEKNTGTQNMLYLDAQTHTLDTEVKINPE